MKKVILLLVTFSMLLTLSALAEMPFEGTVVPFEEYGAQITLPSDWKVIELDAAAQEAGMICSVASPDGKRTFSLQYSQLEKETTVEELKASMETAYGKAEVVSINDLSFVAFDVKDKDITALATLDGDGMGMFVFYFTPASDDAYAPIAQAIAASFGPIAEQ